MTTRTEIRFTAHGAECKITSNLDSEGHGTIDSEAVITVDGHRHRVILESMASGLGHHGYIHTLDLMGNGQSSGIRGRGAGTLVVNNFIGHIKKAAHPDCCLRAKLSDVDDNSISDTPGSDVRQMSREGRARFWKSFGFQVADDGETIQASVKDLRQVSREVRIDPGPPDGPVSDLSPSP